MTRSELSKLDALQKAEKARQWMTDMIAGRPVIGGLDTIIYQAKRAGYAYGQYHRFARIERERQVAQ